ncbi:hypothetical protein [Flavihumibacter petaseus]|uniref:Beta-ketoacyl synthase N-terminal domain-containing protein n=1 Tax=Flavihumibacter petaseus NBRC 106054 TaxID=1220578 RepID=A0A0E9MXE0_9BACT|nr:hypothetical protein [Flavihumibacter petaseus]GAO42086.1 hypothetical protein FPE01S_01_10990 [Flavihumibacter petaseus NBRC 106054]
MPESDTYIQAACRINAKGVWVNSGQLPLEFSGTLTDQLQALYRHLSPGYPKWYKMDRLSQLGVLAAELIMRNAPYGETAPFGRAIVLQNSHSSLDTDLRFAGQLKDLPSPAVFVYTLPNIVTGEISIRFGCKGEQAFFLAAKPDWTTIYQYTKTLFREGNTEFCLTGWLNLYGSSMEAILFAVGNRPGTAGTIAFTPENLLQYYEQGSVN